MGVYSEKVSNGNESRYFITFFWAPFFSFSSSLQSTSASFLNARKEHELYAREHKIRINDANNSIANYFSPHRRDGLAKTLTKFKMQRNVAGVRGIFARET